MSAALKLSSPATREFWEIPILFEDPHLLALDKPAGLLVSPDRFDLVRPNLMRLLHDAIAAGKPWVQERGLAYLCNAHRLDLDTSGILLLAKTKPVLIALANSFSISQPVKHCVALVHGSPKEPRFEVNAKIGPHPLTPGMMRVDPRAGKKAQSIFEVVERFPEHTLLRCQPVTERPHQIRVHLQNSGLRIVGDELYGGRPLLLLRLKRDYRLKPGRVERPLISRVALHVERLELPHPITGGPVTITSALPKDLQVALKYLRLYAS